MSRIYFHTRSETVEVYGSERAYIGQLCAHFAAGVFDMLGWEQQRALLPTEWRERIGPEQLGIDPRTRERFGLFVRSSGERCFADGGEVFATVLNTVLRLGSDPMALAARIHGQCEIHGYVEPEDGEFIAGLIEQGLRDGVFRAFLPRDGVSTDQEMGWMEACRVLRAGEVVVTSYGVCESFPNQSAARCTLTDVWYDLPADERWALGIAGLREGGQGLRWGREGWDEFYFGEGKTALTYLNAARTEVG